MSADALTAVSSAPDYTDRIAGVSLSPSARNLSHLAPKEQAREAARQFEAILVRQLLDESIGRSLMGDSGAQSSVYGYMMTDLFADRLTQGRGLGIGEMLARQLAPREPVSSPDPTSAKLP